MSKVAELVRTLSDAFEREAPKPTPKIELNVIFVAQDEHGKVCEVGRMEYLPEMSKVEWEPGYEPRKEAPNSAPHAPESSPRRKPTPPGSGDY